VELENESGELQQFRIVGPDEFDVKLGFISMDSPLAQAILNKREGDDVVFQGPQGVLEYYLNRVQYEAFS